MKKKVLGIGLAVGLAALIGLVAFRSEREPPPPPVAQPAEVAPDLPDGVRGFYERCISIEQRLLSGEAGDDRGRLIGFLKAYSRDPHPAVAARAADALVKLVHVGLEKQDMSDFGAPLLTIARQGHPETGPLCRRVIDAKVEAWARSNAVFALAEVDGKKHLPFLRRLLDDPLLRGPAAESIGKLERGSNDPELIAHLITTGESVRNPEDLAILARALRRIGGNRATGRLSSWIDRLEGWDRTEVAWEVNDIDPLVALERLVKLGLLSPRPWESSLYDRLAHAHEDGSLIAYTVVRSAFFNEGAGTLIDFWHGNEPRYDRLVAEFTDHAHGRFHPVEIVQETIPEGGFRVTFTDDGRTYSFVAADYDFWYDMAAVAKAVNGALIDRDIRERYLALHAYLNIGMLVLVDPEKLKDAARELYLPLQLDPDMPRKKWLADREKASRKPDQ